MNPELCSLQLAQLSIVAAGCRENVLTSICRSLKIMKYCIQGIEVNGATKHFMAFGGGMRFCVGTDFTKVQMAVFLHCLVTKYRWHFLWSSRDMWMNWCRKINLGDELVRWEVVRGGNTARTPGLQFPDGFYIRMRDKDAHWRRGNCFGRFWTRDECIVFCLIYLFLHTSGVGKRKFRGRWLYNNQLIAQLIQ